MEWTRVYDAAAAPPVNFGVIMGAVVLSTAALITFRVRVQRWPWEAKREAEAVHRLRRALLMTMCVGTLLLASCFTLIDYSESARMRRALETGSYTSVEGRVQDFVAGDPGGHSDESWSVNSNGETYRYHYSWPVDAPGFHQSAGPVRAGMYVRIADVHGAIARLDIRTPASVRADSAGAPGATTPKATHAAFTARN